MGKKYRRRKNKVISVLFFVFILLIGFVFYKLDHQFFNIAIQMTENKCKTIANDIIDGAVQNSISSMDITSADFFEANNQNNSISANTLLINTFCANVSTGISRGIEQMREEKVAVPLGAMTGIDFLATKGPDISFSLVPMGNGTVDYETAFNSVGINQVNFKIWIVVTMELKIINPMGQNTLEFQRKIMLVDTIIQGTVPEQYFNLEPKI